MVGTLNRIKRFVISVMCGIVLLLIGYSIIDRLMACDMVLTTTANYAESQEMDWDVFLDNEKDALSDVIIKADLMHLEFKDSLTFKTNADERTLAVALRYSVSYEQEPDLFLKYFDDEYDKQNAKFEKAIATYENQYMDRKEADRRAARLELLQDAHGQQQVYIAQQKEQLTDKEETIAYHEKLIETQGQYKGMLETEVMKLIHAIKQRDSVGYMGYIEAEVRKNIAKDRNIKKLKKQKQDYIKRADELDIKSGKAEDSLLLATIAVERRELSIASHEIDERIRQISLLLREKLTEECWGKFERAAKLELKEKEAEMQLFESKVIASKALLENLQKELGQKQEAIKEANVAFEANAKELEKIGKLCENVRPEMTLSPIGRHPHLSIIQYMALVILGLLGMSLGWILCPMGQKIYMIQRGKRLNSKAVSKLEGEVPTGLVGDYETMAKQVLKLGTEINPVVLISGYGSPVSTVNLGIALSKEGKNVLVIEAEGNELSEVFDIDKAEGYRQWILGDTDADTVVSTTSLAGLSFMPAGKVVRGEAGDKAGLSIQWLKLRKEFDAIVVYCPGALKPVMHNQDGGNEIEAADGVFVQTSEKMNKKGVALLEEKLSFYEVPLLGVVNN